MAARFSPVSESVLTLSLLLFEHCGGGGGGGEDGYLGDTRCFLCVYYILYILGAAPTDPSVKSDMVPFYFFIFMCTERRVPETYRSGAARSIVNN